MLRRLRPPRARLLRIQTIEVQRGFLRNLRRRIVPPAAWSSLRIARRHLNGAEEEVEAAPDDLLATRGVGGGT